MGDPLLDADYMLGEGSPMIDKGLDVGLAFAGAAPDLGAFEVGLDVCAGLSPGTGGAGGSGGAGSGQGGGGGGDGVGGAAAGGGSSTSGDPGEEGGCGCRVAGGDARSQRGLGGFAIAFVAGLIRARRRDIAERRGQ
jgi:MYXO-CTERM domain-containing protein